MQIENGPVGGEALADVFDPAELAERVKKAGYIRRWCLQNPEGGAVSGESGRIELTASAGSVGICGGSPAGGVFEGLQEV